MIFSVSFLIVLLVSCSKEGETVPAPNPPTTDTPTEPEVDLTDLRKKIAVNVSDGLIIPAYDQLALEVDLLATTTQNFIEAPNEETLQTAQTALKDSWLAWQGAAIYLFGPAETVSLRKSLNTYPTDAHQIETNIQSGEYTLSSLANQAAIGFPAIDYLLNGLGDDPSSIVSFYAHDEGSAGRGHYLLQLIGDIQTRVDNTLNEWKKDKGDYTSRFSEADALGLDVGSSLSLLVNSMDFHFQRFVRDGKVAIPTGIRSAGVPRPKAIEAYYGAYSTTLLMESLSTYHDLFLGINSLGEDKEGLYDYLVAISAKDLADDMLTQFETTYTKAQLLTDPLNQQIEDDIDKMTGVFIEMQKLVVFFKSDMASIMGISITNQDNDGD